MRERRNEQSEVAVPNCNHWQLSNKQSKVASRNKRSEVASSNKQSEVAPKFPPNSMLCKLRPPGEVYIICLIGLLFGFPACKDSSNPPGNTTEKNTPGKTGKPAPSEMVLEPPSAREKPELSFSLRIHELSGHISELALQHEMEFEIEPAQRIEVLANQQLADFRVRLMDLAERVLPSDEEVFLEADLTRVDIRLLSGLRPAHTLTLWVDGQLSPHISNVHQDTYDDFRATFKVRGEPEKPPEKPKTPSQKPHKAPPKKTKRK